MITGNFFLLTIVLLADRQWQSLYHLITFTCILRNKTVAHSARAFQVDVDGEGGRRRCTRSFRTDRRSTREAESCEVNCFSGQSLLAAQVTRARV